MDLTLFFNPLDEALFSQFKTPNSLASEIKANFNGLNDWGEAQIAIIGLCEERGTTSNKGVGEAADVVRKQLYILKKASHSYKIIDLGNLRNAPTLQETYLRLKVVCELLLQENIIPVLIGGSHDLMLGQYWAYQNLEKIISVANIDAFVNVDELSGEENQKHLLTMLTHQPNYLFNFSQIGHQTYLNSTKFLEILERLYFNVYGIGKIRENIENIEPVIREADMLAFDITAIRRSDAPANAYSQPFGLTSDEACQLCWFAGLNDKTSSVGFYEYNPSLDLHRHTAQVLAVMVWYFIEGFYHRKGEIDFQGGAFTKYYVSLDFYTETETNHQLVFYKQLSTEKWWLEVIYMNEKKGKKTHIIPCSYHDYEIAVKGEIPDCWMNAHAKLM
jgi:formiminoglutamase